MDLDPLHEFASFFAKMRESLKEGRFADVRVICADGQTFYCHRLILTAASSFFDRMIRVQANNKSGIIDVKLSFSIPSHIFRLALRYMYSGEVNFLSDYNVYQLLVLSYALQLETVKKACLHHISQKGMSKVWVVRLFKFALSRDDTSLQSTASQFLLKNKDDVLVGWKIRPSESKVLLSYFWASSRIEEESMVERILIWSLPFDRTNSRQQMKSIFMDSVNEHAFKYLPQNYAADCFERMIADDYPIRLREGVSRVDNRSRDYRQQSALYMFTNSQRTPLRLSTLATRGSSWNSRSLNVYPGTGTIRKLRCTVVGGRLYWLSCCDGHGQPSELDSTFHSTVLGKKSISLESPFTTVHTAASLHVCSDERSLLFACVSDSTILRWTDSEQIQWSSVNLGDDFFPRTMTWHDRQLYLLGGASPTSTVNRLITFDLRQSRSCQVLQEVHDYTAHYECCSHRERLYLASFRDCISEMIIFDPVAGKARIMLTPPSAAPDLEFRLASFKDSLWTIICDTNHSIRGHIFDPYSHTFEDALVDGMVDPGSQLLDVVVYKRR